MDIPVHRLLATAERALDKLDWGQVYVLASEVLVLDPGNAEAIMLCGLAERRGGRTSIPGRRQATALFADLVGSTPLAEHHDVEVYTAVLRAFMDTCTPAVTKHEGHVVDIRGDGIVACFGYPNAHEDDACRAVSAALDMLTALLPVATEQQAERGIRLQVRIGIDTGLVVVYGADVSGASLNRAARLQDLAAPDSVLISAATNQLVADRFETRSLGRRKLKGVDTPVEVFRVLRPRDRSRYGARMHSPSSPLIGRDAELAHTLDVWHRMVNAGPEDQRRCEVAVIVGEPGIGKSRLASAVVERIAPAAQRVFQLYCSSYSATSTLFPLRAGLERYADMNSDDTDVERLDKLEAACADLGIDSAGILPALGTLLDVDLAGRYPPLDLSPAQLQRVLLERMTALLPNITEGPAILVLEDLQWADPTTLELLDRLAAVGLPRGLLILGTARPGLRWTPSNDSAATIRLGALSDAEAQEVALAAGAGGLSEADAQEIVARADGVPLFVEQLTHAFGEIGLSTLSNESVPQTLIQLLQARLDAVGSAKLVAQVAATIGREFHVELVETVMAKLAGGGAPDACAVPVEHHLKQLADADLIEPMKYDGLLRFRHALMRDAAYQAQLMRDRRARHGVVADILAEAKTGDAALTAFHFEHAERPLDALSHYLQAVSRAQTGGCPEFRGTSVAAR